MGCSRLLLLLFRSKSLTLLKDNFFSLIPFLQVLTEYLLFNSVIDCFIKPFEKESEFFCCLLNIFWIINVCFLWVNNFFNFIYDPVRYSLFRVWIWCAVVFLLLIIPIDFIFDLINNISATIINRSIIKPIEIVSFFTLVVFCLFLTWHNFYWKDKFFLFACWVI